MAAEQSLQRCRAGRSGSWVSRRRRFSGRLGSFCEVFAVDRWQYYRQRALEAVAAPLIAYAALAQRRTRVLHGEVATPRAGARDGIVRAERHAVS